MSLWSGLKKGTGSLFPYWLWRSKLTWMWVTYEGGHVASKWRQSLADKQQDSKSLRGTESCQQSHEHGRGFFPSWTSDETLALTNTLIKALQTTQLSHSWTLTHRNWEIINACCIEPKEKKRNKWKVFIELSGYSNHFTSMMTIIFLVVNRGICGELYRFCLLDLFLFVFILNLYLNPS